MKRIVFHVNGGLELSLCNTCAIPIEISGEKKMQFPRESGWGCMPRLPGWRGEMSLY